MTSDVIVTLYSARGNAADPNKALLNCRHSGASCEMTENLYRIRIRSLDGGCIRGLGLSKILTALYQHIKEPVYTNILLVKMLGNPALPESFLF